MADAKKYILDKVVTGTFDMPEKTALGGKILMVTFEDGSQKPYTEKSYKNILSDEATDATKFRELKCNPIVQEMLLLMQEANLTMGEVNYTLELTAISLDKSSTDALNKIFKVDFPDHRSLLAIDAVLKGNEPFA